MVLIGLVGQPCFGLSSPLRPGFGWLGPLAQPCSQITTVNLVDPGRGFGIVPVSILPNHLSSGQNSSSCLLRWNLLASISTKLMLRLLQFGPSAAEMWAKSGCTGVLHAFPMVDAFLGIRLEINTQKNTSINAQKKKLKIHFHWWAFSFPAKLTA